MIGRISFVIFPLVFLVGYQAAKSQSNGSINGFELVDKAGNIRKPSDFRSRYEALGTHAVLDPKGNQMHFTYASRYGGVLPRTWDVCRWHCTCERSIWNGPRANDHG